MLGRVGPAGGGAIMRTWPNPLATTFPKQTMSIDAKLERPKSLTDLAVDRIRATIIEGRFALGEQLSEAVLASSLGISKTPVREALFRLKLEGLVEVHPQRGTFVFEASEDEVREICAFRQLIESAALARAIERSRSQLVTTLEPILAATRAAEQAGDFAAIPALDTQFHESILASAGSAYLSASYALISSKIQALRSRLPDHRDEVKDCTHIHDMILDEIRGGTAARAQKLLREHIRDTQDAYLAASANKSALIA